MRPFMAINFYTPLDKKTSLRDFHQSLVKDLFGLPTGLPSEDMFRLTPLR